MDRWDWWKESLEYLGGGRDVPPGRPLPTPRSLLWGLWWAVLTTIIVLFCGQSSKFIYIDF